MKKQSRFLFRTMRLADGSRVRISLFEADTYFGVRNKYQVVVKKGMFLSPDTPGSGFFVRDSDSHSYREFCRELRKKKKHSLWKLVTGKEATIAKEIGKVEKALTKSAGTGMTPVLTHYQDVLYMARQEEFLQRIMEGIKVKMKGKKGTSQYARTLTQYKSRAHTMGREVLSRQINISTYTPAEVLEQWQKVVEAFNICIDSRRVWQVVATEGDPFYMPVFFDMGIFDYIQSPFDTPIMRDSEGNHYYLYPDAIIRARSSVDFDVIPMKELSFEFAPVNLNMLDDSITEAVAYKRHNRKMKGDSLASLFGMCHHQHVGQILIPELNLTFYVSKPSRAEQFVNALNEYKKLEWSPVSPGLIE